jgi:serine protease Do
MFPIGQADTSRDKHGLSIRFPTGELKLRQDTGVHILFSLRGDFEVTLSYEVLRADQPTKGDGAGPILSAPNLDGTRALSLARRFLPDGKALFVAKWGSSSKTMPSTATAGKLRLERTGNVLRFRARDGNQRDYVTVAETEFGKADIPAITIASGTGGSDTALDVRFLDLRMRAEVLPGYSDLKQLDRSSIPRFDMDQLTDLETKIQKLYARLAPSVVRITDPATLERNPGSKGKTGFSGVIVSSSGEILTCAHHGLAPKTKVVAVMSDGRRVKATILGRIQQAVKTAGHYAGADIGMVQLDEKSEWPAVQLGLSSRTKAGELCIGIGQPDIHFQPGRPPLLRLGRLLVPDPLGRVRNSCRMFPGDSGSPLFDLEGRVLGIQVAMESLRRAGCYCSTTESFLKFRDRLRAGEEVPFEKAFPERVAWRKDAWGSWEPTMKATVALSATHASTVEILGDEKLVALGLIVDGAGWVLTKRTALIGPHGARRLVCRLPSGTRLEAQLKAESREHDLALVKIAALEKLPAVRWGKSDGLRIGQLIACLGPAQQPLQCGIIGAVHVENPGTKGYLPISVKPAEKDLSGVAFTTFLPSHLQMDDVRRFILPGDLVTHLDDVATPTVDAFVRVRDQRIAGPGVFAGERVKLTLRRDNKTVQVFVPLVDGPTLFPSVWRDAPWNLRRNGFPAVFCHDAGISPAQCGGPVVDLSGQVIGINIARVNAVQTFAIPANAVRKLIAELMERGDD